MLLDRFKVKEEDLQDFMEGRTVVGRTVLIDGDALCYKVTATAKKLETAERNFVTGIYEIMFLTGATFARVHLTPKGCYKNGRHLLRAVKPYQGNRKGKPKPPLLEALRLSAQTLFTPQENVVVLPHYQVEADDAIMCDSYLDKEYVVWSEDKDLQIVPCKLYDIYTGIISTIDDTFGYIKESTTTGGNFKVKGHGTKFFWYQMLAGDQADNVKGILKYDGALCGPRKAYEVIAGTASESEAANVVLNAYRKIHQNPIPEGECMWLIRHKQDSFVEYARKLDLTKENLDYLRECYRLDYRMTQEEYDAVQVL